MVADQRLTDQLAAADQRLADQQAAAAQQLSDQDAMTDKFGGIAAQKLLEMLDKARDEVQREGQQTSKTLEGRLQETVKPLHQELGHLRDRNKELHQFLISTEKKYGSVDDRLANLGAATARLHEVLSNSQNRGKWGEQQLERILELSAMKKGSNYKVQRNTGTTSRKYPDAIVYLPNDLTVLIDSKAPLKAYIEAIDASDEPTREAKLVDHAKAVAQYAKDLGRKEYRENYDSSDKPDRVASFVVMFLPIDDMLQTALSKNSTLQMDAWKQQVVFATPGVLMALLDVVSLSWSLSEVEQRGQKIMNLGTELHNRLSKFAEYLAKMGGGLDTAVTEFNKAVGSWGRMLVPKTEELARERLGDAKKEIPELTSIETAVRSDVRELETLEVVDLDDGIGGSAADPLVETTANDADTPRSIAA